MRITGLHLRNYRVYEEPLDLEMPAGLVGIYGPNGAGKSTLLESIVFCLWGKARTPKDEIRTSDVGGECVAEVEFEHEGHLYVVRRTISGQASTVRAQAYADGAQVSEGVRDTGRYVHSILGMDDVSFRASVFAEQKQLAAFSANAPAERRRLVLGLLGVTPLDAAREMARKESRDRRASLDQTRGLLADLDRLGQELEAAREEAAAATRRSAAAGEAEDAAAVELACAEAEHQRVSLLGAAYEALVKEGQGRRRELQEAEARVAAWQAEVAELDGVESRLAPLVAEAEGVGEAEEALALASAVSDVEAELAAVGEVPDATRPDEAAVSEARQRALEARRLLAEAEGRLVAATETAERARRDAASAGGLSGEEHCPVCGQALGSAFEAVRAHRQGELEAAEKEVSRLEADRSRRLVEAERLGALETQAEARLAADRQAWQVRENALSRRSEAEARLAQARGAARARGPLRLNGGVVELAPANLAALRQALEARRAAAVECGRLRGRLERRPALEAELVAGRERVVTLGAEVEGLRAKVRDLDYRPEALGAAADARRAAKEASAAAARAASEARVAAAKADERAAALASRLEEAREQHAKVEALADEARHLGRLGELLTSFRNTVVAAIGPRLSAQAAELFGELTDHEYDELAVDPETYEVQIRDHGRAHAMSRFSGSETDLANLALRVAISEQIRFQSGGAVGLLVLDEVFGPLDDERKERMVAALERLGGRFRQILVVTHDSDVKQLLPGAIEVVKLPGRRARAAVV